VETPYCVEIIVSGNDFDELCQEATRSAIRLVCQRRNCGFDEAYAIVGQTSDLKVLQVVNYCTTLSIQIPKALL
jgi:acetamidase/formamidase